MCYGRCGVVTSLNLGLSTKLTRYILHVPAAIFKQKLFNTSCSVLVVNEKGIHGKLSAVKAYTVQCSLVKPPPSVQSVVWRFCDKLRDIENRKSCDQMKRLNFSTCFNSTDIHFALVQRHKYK